MRPVSASRRPVSSSASPATTVSPPFAAQSKATLQTAAGGGYQKSLVDSGTLSSSSHYVSSSSAPTTATASSPLIPPDVMSKIQSSRVTSGGAVVVTAVTARHLNALPNSHLTTEYTVTLSPARRNQSDSAFCTVPHITSEPVKAVHDISAGGWTLTFRDVHAIFPIDDDCDGRLGILATIHSTCGQHQFGAAMCRSPKEWCALSRPRGEVQIVFHEVVPTHEQQQQQQLSTVGNLHQTTASPATTNANHTYSMSNSAMLPQRTSMLPTTTTAAQMSSSAHVTPTPTTSHIMSSFASRPSTANARAGGLYGGHLGRPNTASALGRAPLGALQHHTHPYSVTGALSNSSHTTNGGVPPGAMVGGVVGRYPPSPPRPMSSTTPGSGDWNTGRAVVGVGGGNTTITTNNIAAAAAGSPTFAAGAPRTVVFSDWVLEDLPPPPAGVDPDNYGVYLVVRYAHTENRLQATPVIGGGRTAAGASSPSRLAEVVAKRKSAGLTSSDEDDEDDEDDDTIAGGGGRGYVNRSPPHSGGGAKRVATWPVGVSQPFEIPLALQESKSSILVYVCDHFNPDGGRFLAETTCTIDVTAGNRHSLGSGESGGGGGSGRGAAPAPPHRSAMRVTFTGAVKLTASFTVQILRHEAQKEGAGGRPTSAFPRRGSNNTTTAAASSHNGSSNAPLTTSSMPSLPTATTLAPSHTVAGGRRSDGAPDDDDDFVRDDDDDDDAGYHGAAEEGASGGSSGAAARSSVTQPQHRVGNNGQQGTDPHPQRPTTAQVKSLNAFAEAFEATLHTTLRTSFHAILERLGSIEKRVSHVEERIQHHMSGGVGSGGSGGPTISIRPMSAASDTEGGGTAGGSAAGTPGSVPPGAGSLTLLQGPDGHHQGLLPSTPHSPPPTSSSYASAFAAATHLQSAPGSASSHRGATASASMTSRPNSGDTNSYRGATLFPDAAFPEHGNPLFTEQQLEQKFRRYDTDGRGVLTKAQLVQFYRTHNSFSIDETNDDIEAELRRFACPRLDEDAVTFNQFCLVALRLAKI